MDRVTTCVCGRHVDVNVAIRCQVAEVSVADPWGGPPRRLAKRVTIHNLLVTKPHQNQQRMVAR